MPPASKRRRTSGQTSPFPSSATTKSQKSAQSTLSFRASKASTRAPPSNKKKDEEATLATPAPVTDIDVQTEEDNTQQDEPRVLAIDVDDPSAKILQSADVEEEAEDEVEVEQAELDKKALSLSEAKIKAYWAEKEKERKAPRVHQQGLTVREKVLREFDMSTRYGPSIGIARVKRWRRAQALGMEPPVEVLAVLLKEEQKGAGVSQRSIMDDLIMSSRMRGDNLAELS